MAAVVSVAVSSRPVLLRVLLRLTRLRLLLPRLQAEPQPFVRTVAALLRVVVLLPWLLARMEVPQRPSSKPSRVTEVADVGRARGTASGAPMLAVLSRVLLTLMLPALRVRVRR